MKLDVTRVVLAANNKPILTDETPAAPATFRWLAMQLLTGVFHDDHPSPLQKYDRYKLCQRIDRHDTVDLRSNEVELLKNLSGIAYGPNVMGPIWDLLDPPAEPAAEPVPPAARPNAKRRP